MEEKKAVCAACNNPFQCLPENITACHCYGVVLSDAAKDWIKAQYEGCLCSDCLQKIQEQFPVIVN
jgi:ribosomal protein L34E